MALLLIGMAPGSHAAGQSAGSKYLVYIGTYAKDPGQGINLFRFDAATGQASAVEVAAAIENPSFLAIHPSGKFLYAVGELASGGSVTALAIEPGTGRLTRLNSVSSRGGGPCHVSVDPSGRCVLIANYGSGSIAAFPVLPDGRLGEASAFVQHSGSGPNAKRQAGPHAHSVTLSEDSRFVIAADLGLDKLLVYRFDADKGTLQANEPAFTMTEAGAGPRHFTFLAGRRLAYVINELNSTVTAFNFDPPKGVLSPIESVSTLPKDFSGTNYPADIHVDAQGRFLYGSNRGHDSIAVFSIDARSGRLASIQHVSTQGKNPRNFNIDPTGATLLVANQNSNNIVFFRIDQKTGRLTPTGTELQVASPVCIKFLPLDEHEKGSAPGFLENWVPTKD